MEHTGPLAPPPITVTFNRNPEKFAFFLNQVWAHMDRYVPMYADDVACMDIIVANLKEEEAEWVMALHDKEVPKLGDLDAFLGELRDHFGDSTQVQRAEPEIHAIRQGSRP